MNINYVLEYINGLSINARKHGPDYMQEILELMGNPHNNQKYIHVAGTNGKGSTVNYISNILIESGYKTGVYTSPHIDRFMERMKINNEEITQDEWVEIALYVKEKAEILIENGRKAPSIFQFLTAMAFEFFKIKKCDFIVLETGMGGATDPTNIINSTVISVITKIGIDHVNYLGSTIEGIALEKAGIIKQGANVVLYPQDSKVESIINGFAANINAHVDTPNFDAIKILEQDIEKQTFSYGKFNSLEIHMFGKHQIENAILAVTVANVLKDKGYNITEQAIKVALKSTKWPGRSEVLSKEPIFILDGAHNEDGLETLVKSLKAFFKNRRIIFIFGAHTNKDYDAMLKIVSPIAKMFITFTPNYHNGLCGHELANIATKYCSNVIGKVEVEDAITTSLKVAQKNDVICVIGSLFCIKEVRDYFNCGIEIHN